MDLVLFVEGPLLRITMITFAGAVAARLSFFVASVIRSSTNRESPGIYLLGTLARFFAPLHMLINRRPKYFSLRIAFHICMVAVPVWLSSHIVLWELSRLGWSWPALPAWLADVMTLLLIGLIIFFVMRRIIVPEVSDVSSRSDYVLLAITGVPFLTGFFSTHGTLEGLPLFGANMQVIHELSGEAMLIAAAVLFCRPRIYQEKCIGCAACELSCPTGTLVTTDQHIYRIFRYSHYQCICCGSCATTCPEDATELRHELSGKRFFQIASKYKIRSVELKECEHCGARFAPEPQLEKIRSLPEFEKVREVLKERHLRLCPQCRRVSHADVFYRVAPIPKKPTKSISPGGRPLTQPDQSSKQ